MSSVSNMSPPPLNKSFTLRINLFKHSLLWCHRKKEKLTTYYLYGVFNRLKNTKSSMSYSSLITFSNVLCNRIEKYCYLFVSKLPAKKKTMCKSLIPKPFPLYTKHQRSIRSIKSHRMKNVAERSTMVIFFFSSLSVRSIAAMNNNASK